MYLWWWLIFKLLFNRVQKFCKLANNSYLISQLATLCLNECKQNISCDCNFGKWWYLFSTALTLNCRGGGSNWPSCTHFSSVSFWECHIWYTFYVFLLWSLTHLLEPSLQQFDNLARGHATFCNHMSAKNLTKIRLSLVFPICIGFVHKITNLSDFQAEMHVLKVT